eukprot:5765583-Prymnesium_polylepis.1
MHVTYGFGVYRWRRRWEAARRGVGTASLAAGHLALRPARAPLWASSGPSTAARAEAEAGA